MLLLMEKSSYIVQAMKIIFMGTPEIAVPCLDALVKKGWEVPLVITQPDRPKGRGNQMQPTPVKEYAVKAGLQVYQPERLKNNPEALEMLKSLQPDFFAVAAYGRILPQEILDVPKFAPVNVHFSLLPKYRGAAPVNWAIVNGDETTGVSTMLMDAGMDTGDILLRKETPVERKNAAELAQELSVSGAELLIKTLENFDIITPLKQNEQESTLAPIMKKDDGVIDWSKSADEIERAIRGFYPWPAVYSYLDGRSVKFFAAEVDDSAPELSVGTVYAVGKDYFSVSTGRAGLKVKELQFEGKKRMDVKSFLAGSRIETGMKFVRSD